MAEVEHLVKILKEYEGSSFEPVKEQWITEIENNHPNMPSDLKELYLTLGYGCIGDSRYMIHVPMEPADIYDKETAKELSGVLIVGDDFAGNCEAYDTNKNWQFGSIADDGVFEVYGDNMPSFISFLTEWFEGKENA